DARPAHVPVRPRRLVRGRLDLPTPPHHPDLRAPPTRRSRLRPGRGFAPLPLFGQPRRTRRPPGALVPLLLPPLPPRGRGPARPALGGRGRAPPAPQRHRLPRLRPTRHPTPRRRRRPPQPQAHRNGPVGHGRTDLRLTHRSLNIVPNEEFHQTPPN